MGRTATETGQAETAVPMVTKYLNPGRTSLFIVTLIGTRASTSEDVVAGKATSRTSVLFAAVPALDPLFSHTRATLATFVPSETKVK